MRHLFIIAVIILGTIFLHDIWRGTQVSNIVDDCYEIKASNFDVKFTECEEMRDKLNTSEKILFFK